MTHPPRVIVKSFRFRYPKFAQRCFLPHGVLRLLDMEKVKAASHNAPAALHSRFKLRQPTSWSVSIPLSSAFNSSSSSARLRFRAFRRSNP